MVLKLQSTSSVVKSVKKDTTKKNSNKKKNNKKQEDTVQSVASVNTEVSISTKLAKKFSVIRSAKNPSVVKVKSQLKNKSEGIQGRFGIEIYFGRL